MKTIFFLEVLAVQIQGAALGAVDLTDPSLARRSKLLVSGVIAQKLI
jgi:hypothetical protein